METHKILFDSLDKAEMHFEAGEIRAAQKIINQVSRAMRSNKKVSNKLRHRFNFMSAQSRYFNDISLFATNPKRNEIIQKLEKLIAIPSNDPKKQANTIHSLQTKWQLLDQSSKPAKKDQWITFKELTNKAWEPCAQYYEELKEVKINNAKERKKIIEDLNNYAETNSKNWPNLTELNKHLNKTFKLWQSYAPVLDESYSKLKSDYSNARKKINNEIRRQENKNFKLKEEVITKVKLISDKDNNICLQKFKKLKNDYQNIGSAGKKQEKKLWIKLNKNADRFFETEKSLFKDELVTIDSLMKELIKENYDLTKIKSQISNLRKSKRTKEFKELMNSIKTLEKKNLEIKNLKKVETYVNILDYLESDEIDYLELSKEIKKVLQKPLYLANDEELIKSVVMIELISGTESPVSNKSIRQAASIELLQNKFSGFETNSNKLKELIISFINNLNSKKINAKEKKLWKRLQTLIPNIINDLP